MKTRIQIVLLITAVLFGAWGLGLLLAPEYSQRLISSEPYNSVLAHMLGASFTAWMAASLVAARTPSRDIVLAVAIGTLIVSVVAVVLMFGSGAMPVRDTNIASLVVALGAAGYLLFAERLIAGMTASRRQSAGRRGKRKAVRKSAASRPKSAARPRRRKTAG